MRRGLHVPGKYRRQRRTDLIRNFWGKPIPCCWNDCTEHASTKHQVTVPHDAPERAKQRDTLTYAFCSATHLGYWLSGNVPGGYGKNLQGRRSPLGLILP